MRFCTLAKEQHCAIATAPACNKDCISPEGEVVTSSERLFWSFVVYSRLVSSGNVDRSLAGLILWYLTTV
jgi:hypothetical protein